MKVTKLVVDATCDNSSPKAGDKANNHLSCEPGSILIVDYRSEAMRKLPKSEDDNKGSLKVVQFNIERGYKLSRVISVLKSLDADILCLQELDIGCERSGSVDTFDAIAKELELNAVFVNEFKELYSKRRKKKDQGGGIHGNAIMTRFDMSEVEISQHKFQPYDWNRNGEKIREPRIGQRYSLRARLTDSRLVNEGKQIEIDVFSLHLEPFTGMLGRIAQFSEILHWISKPSASKYVIIGGDLNTLSHGAARFVGPFGGDKLRYRTFGWSEGEWWYEHILKNWHLPHEYSNNEKACLSNNSSTNCKIIKNPLVESSLPVPSCLSQLYIKNPGLLPTFPHNTQTFQFFHRHIYSAKLDWLLLRHLRVVSKGIANNNFAASDHKVLYATVQFEENDNVWKDLLQGEFGPEGVTLKTNVNVCDASVGMKKSHSLDDNVCDFAHRTTSYSSEDFSELLNPGQQPVQCSSPSLSSSSPSSKRHRNDVKGGPFCSDDDDLFNNHHTDSEKCRRGGILPPEDELKVALFWHEWCNQNPVYSYVKSFFRSRRNVTVLVVVSLLFLKSLVVR